MNKKIIGLFILAVCIAMAIIYQPEKITIKLGVFSGSNWDVPSGESNQIVDNAIKIFEEIHPNVKVKYESGILKEDYSSWLADKILTGDTPDVYIILEEDFSLLSSIGALKNLNSYILKDKNFDEQEYYKSVLEAGTYNGYQYALPYECDPTLMFVNKTLLQKEGIEIPNNDWTLDDFYEICQKVTRDSNNDGIIDQYGCYDYDWLDSIYSHGIQIFNDPVFKKSLWNTLFLVIGNVPIVVVFSLFVSLTIYKRSSKVRSFFRSIFYLPAIASVVSITVVWGWIFHPNYGILNYILS